MIPPHKAARQDDANVSRRAFMRASLTAPLLLSVSGAVAGMNTEPPAPDAGKSGLPPGRFFQDSDFSYVFLCALGRAHYSGSDIGKLLALVGQITDGDSESAYQAFMAAGDEASAIAAGSAQRNHRVSARQAYLWAAGYYDSATYFVDGTADSDRFLPTWEKARNCWDKAVAHFDPVVERIEIPYENTKLQGYFFRTHVSGKRPLLILNNGSDGSPPDMWQWGAAAGVVRGYHCLTFDGPGQGYALWKQKLYFRPDWEKVITPVVDYAVKRKDVDPKRIALQGISQGGYWVPRAVAFEPRIAAAIADPGVMDVSTSWTGHLPPEMIALLSAGKKTEFDQIMSRAPSSQSAGMRFRMRPYGFSSPYDAFKAAQSYNLEAVVGQIRCPMLITDPEGEQFWPGQSQALYQKLTCPKTLVPFTAAEGANLHCEPKSAGLRDLRVFDWLDEILK